MTYKKSNPISLNTHALAHYTLANVPCTSSLAIKLAFNALAATFENVENNSYSKSSVIAANYSQLDRVAFYIDPDGDSPELHRAYMEMGLSGYAFSIFTFNPEVLVLDAYHVGVTKLKDFQDPHIAEVNVGEELIYCSSNDDAKYGYQLTFKVSDEQFGSSGKNISDKEVLGDAVLVEARFYVANRRLRKTSILSPFGGILMALQGRLMSLSTKFSGNSNDFDRKIKPLNAMDFIVSKGDVNKQLLASYIYFIENSIHGENVGELKKFVRRVFTENPEKDQNFYSHAILCYHDEEYVQKKFVLTFDWKEDISSAVGAMTSLLGPRLSAKLPSTEVFGDVGISHEDFIPSLETALESDDLGFNFLSDGSDQYHFVFFESSKKEEFKKHINHLQM